MLLLLVLGCIMQISIGPAVPGGSADPYGEVRKQGSFMALGLLLLVIAYRVDYRLYAQWSWVIYGLAVVLLVLCFVPGIGQRINGAVRWTRFGGITFQPSEFAKIAGVIIMASWCARRAESRRTFYEGFFLPMLFAGALVLLIAGEVDLGNASLMLIGTLSVLFAAGAKLRYLGTLILGAGAALVATILTMPERVGRVLAFMDLEKYRTGDGMQQWLGLLAYGSGASNGVGVGNSRLKMSLPYPNSDMISPIIGEELGGWFMIFLVAVYVVLAIAGYFIAIKAPDRFGKLLAFGLVSLLSAQAVIHFGVTTAMLPNKGIPLPFVSAGGSNMVCLILSVGILLNIFKQTPQSVPADALLGRAKLTPAV